MQRCSSATRKLRLEQDLRRALQNGEFEDAVPLNSTFAEGDWNGDREFDTNDLIYVLQQGATDFVFAHPELLADAMAKQIPTSNSNSLLTLGTRASAN